MRLVREIESKDGQNGTNYEDRCLFSAQGHYNSHIIETCECLDCGETTEAKSGMVRGTSLGPNLLGVGGRLLGDEEHIRRRVRFTGKQVRRKTTIQHWTRWSPGWSQNMKDSLKDTDYIGYDETSYHVMEKSGWAWVAASRDAISCHLAASRSRATFEEHVMVPGRLATVDVMDVTQRCWAHILRDAAAEVRAVEKASMELADCRVLLERLKYLTEPARDT